MNALMAIHAKAPVLGASFRSLGAVLPCQWVIHDWDNGQYNYLVNADRQRLNRLTRIRSRRDPQSDVWYLRAGTRRSNVVPPGGSVSCYRINRFRKSTLNKNQMGDGLVAAR
jgi:hypothetical protein